MTREEKIEKARLWMVTTENIAPLPEMMADYAEKYSKELESNVITDNSKVNANLLKKVEELEEENTNAFKSCYCSKYADKIEELEIACKDWSIECKELKAKLKLKDEESAKF